MVPVNVDILPASHILSTYKNKPAAGQMAETFICDFEWRDGIKSRAYVKCFRKDRQLGLLNEVTGYVLGKYAGISLPDRAALVQIPDGAFPDVNKAEFFEFAFAISESAGDTLVSCYKISTMQKFTYLRNLVKNWSGVDAAMAFDDWVANQDRNMGNILVSGPNDIVLIDHSNLPVGLNWTAACLNSGLIADNKLERILFAPNDVPASTVDKMKSAALNHPDAFSSAQAVMCEWWDRLLPSDPIRRSALEDFIVTRAANGMTRIDNQKNGRAA